MYMLQQEINVQQVNGRPERGSRLALEINSCTSGHQKTQQRLSENKQAKQEDKQDGF